MDKINKTDTLEKILAKRSFSIDVFQREYRWGRKQIEQMLSDFQNTFEEFYDPKDHNTTADVINYGYYYMGCIICTEGTPSKIIDGQQRLTSLTLLLIYLNNLQKTQPKQINFDDMIYADHYGVEHFNINVEERYLCLKALLANDTTYRPTNESSQNMMDRYKDIEELFPDELKGEALAYFIYWLKDHVLLLEIDTPSEDEAHTIFLTMNDRGLSLNSAEMMKAYVIQQITEDDRYRVNRIWQKNINEIKGILCYEEGGIVNTEDVEFISTWLRAKYACSLREGKKGAKEEDFEQLGEKFHEWVRNNAKTKMDLTNSVDFVNFVTSEMTKVTKLYLNLRKYSQTLTKDYEDVFYNANRDLNYQVLLIISAIKNDDDDDKIKRKIQMIAKFIDIFASLRIFNFKKANWNSNKYMLFRIMREIRNQDCKFIGLSLVKNLRRMDTSIEGLANFRLNQYSKRYMLHFLARFTSYVNELMGNPSNFDIYVNRKRKGNTYDIEHILPDDFDSYHDAFNDVDDFNSSRQLLGNLIILTQDKNRSYQDMLYEEKVKKYVGDNVLAQALSDVAYHNNPKFLEIARYYGFNPIPKFTKASIAERTEIYLRLANDIWDYDIIKELAGGWSDDEEKILLKKEKAKEFTVEYSDRSWADARKYGFLSANICGSGKSLKNIQEGDIIYCHIAGFGFVGIGQCLSSAVPMKNFYVEDAGNKIPVSQIEWLSPSFKSKLDENLELFIRIDWKCTVEKPEDGYKEKGLTILPLVAYSLSDQTTYKKVKQYFRYEK